MVLSKKKKIVSFGNDRHYTFGLDREHFREAKERRGAVAA